MANQEIDSLSLEITIKGLNDKDIKNLESLSNSIAKLQRNLKKLELNKLQEIQIPQNLKGITGVSVPLNAQIDSSFKNESQSFEDVFKDSSSSLEKMEQSTEKIKANIKGINTDAPKIKGSIKEAGVEAEKANKKIKKPKKQLSEIEKQLKRIKTIGLVKLIRGAIQGFIKGMGEGYKNLALFDSQFNETLSALKTAKTQTFNSLALITAPLVSVITPAITMISNSLVNVANKVSEITASLKGATTYTKINSKYMEDYAKSMEKAQAFSFDTFNSLDIQNDSMFENGELDEAVDQSSNLFTIFSDLKDTFEDIKDILSEVGSLFKQLLADNIDSIKEIISQSKELTKSIKQLFSSINFSKLLKTISKVITDIVNNTGIVLDLVEDILEVATPLIDVIISDLLPALLEIFSDSINPIFTILKALSPVIVSIVDSVVSVLSPILKAISPIISSLGDVIDGIAEQISFIIETLISGNIIDLLNNVNTQLAPIVTVLTEVLNIVTGIFDMFSGLLHLDLDGFVNGFKSAVISIGMTIVKFFASIIDGIINSIIESINLIIANDAVKKIAKAFGGDWEGISWRSTLAENLPSFANGGIVGELWQMNEYGNPEMLYNANGNSTAVITQDQLARAFENAIFNTGLLDAITDSKNIYIDGKNIAQSKNFKSELNRTNPNLNIK